MPNDKIRPAHMVCIAHFLGKQELLAAGATTRDFREFTESEIFKRFGLDFLRIIKNGDVRKFNALVSRYPRLIFYRFNPEDNTDHKPEDIAAFKNMTALDLVLSRVASEEARDEESELNFGPQLLHHVIRGNQMAVEVLLIRYPQLLSYRGDAIDYSGRRFKNVTAFELAIWALDVRHMARAMLKCITRNAEGLDKESKDYSEKLVPELKSQFDNFVKKDGGVNYSIGCGLLKMLRDPSQLLPSETPEQRDALLNRLLGRHNGCIQYNDRLFYFHNHRCPKELEEITDSNAIKALQGIMSKEEKKLTDGQLQIINNDAELEIVQKNISDSRHIFKEKHYDFTPLIRALDVYAQSFNPGISWTSDKRDAHWCTIVGLAQHYAPAHVAQHYCNPDESFVPKYNNTPPTFKEKILKRVLIVYKERFIRGDKSEAWWPISSIAGSKDLGLDIGVFRGDFPGRARLKEALDCIGPEASVDSLALTALCKVRKAALKRLLNSFQKPEVDSEPTCCVDLS